MIPHRRNSFVVDYAIGLRDNNTTGLRRLIHFVYNFQLGRNIKDDISQYLRLTRTAGLLLLLAVWSLADTLAVRIPGWQSVAAYWPPAPRDARRAPVVVWLHGGMGSANCAKGLTAGLPLLDSALHKKAWVVSPSACGEHHWVASGPALVDALLDSLERRRGFAVDSIELVGVSDGGMGVVAYSLQGRRTVTRRLLISTYAGQLADASLLAQQPRIRQGRWIFLQGGADRLFPPARTRPWMTEFCSHLGSLQCLVRFDPSGEHDYAWWRAHRLDWLQQSLR